jgi:hypothetical protein
MKKYLSPAVTFLILIFLFSCKKENTNKISANSESKNIRTELIAEIQNLPKSNVALGYRKLTNPEKVVFWKIHLDNYINSRTISQNLRSHIELLRNFISEDVYNTLGTPTTDKYVADFTEKWYTIPIKQGLFKTKDLVEIATLLGVGRDGGIGTSFVPPPPGTTCDCRYNISCGSYRSCYASTYCEDNGPFECGLFGTSRCDGTCKFD